MTMTLSYLFAAVNHKLILTVTVGDKEGYVSKIRNGSGAPSDMVLNLIRRNLGMVPELKV